MRRFPIHSFVDSRLDDSVDIARTGRDAVQPRGH